LQTLRNQRFDLLVQGAESRGPAHRRGRCRGR
jgi:hypothetical protein